MPTGLTLATNGLISGTQSTPGTFTFQYTATDGSGLTSVREVTMQGKFLSAAQGAGDFDGDRKADLLWR